ncbi:MAG: hypothetical protein ACOCW3_00750 [Spirochaetota bacterium]
MKRLSALLFLLVVCAVAVSAQQHYLANESGTTLYVAVDVEEGIGPLAELTLDPRGEYMQLPVDAVLPYSPGEPVAGFAFTRDSFQLPTFAVSADEATRRTSSAASGRRYVAVTEDDLTSERVVSASAFAELLGEPRIDNQYLDWVGRDAHVARGRGRAPLGVYADLGDGREPIALDDSLLWQRGGTDLGWIKTHATPYAHFLAASVYTEFARGTTLFLYVYREEGEVPVATLELPGDEDRGLVLLWTPTQPEPVVAGNLVASEFFLEAQIWRSTLEAEAGAEPESLVVETATASSAAGVWEEFVLGRDPFSVLFGE